MRKSFAAALHEKMKTDDRVFLIVGDLGFGLFDKIRKDFPERAYNCGACEQAMMGVAVGLAMSNKIVFVYSITPFLLWRTAETIRNYVDKESVPVKMVGSGRDDCYMEDGFSHHAFDVPNLLKLFKNIETHWPDDKDEISSIVGDMINSNKPSFLSLKR